MHNHEAHVPVVLNVPDDFTGRVLVYWIKESEITMPTEK